MTDLLTLGASGLRAYARAMGTIGDNIANAQSPGYARRTAQIGETIPASGSAFASRNEASSGLRTITTERITNQWRIDDSRDAAADAGLTGTSLRWVQAVEDALANGGSGIEQALGAFFNAADQLSADPASTPLRQQFLVATGGIARTVQQTASALQDVSGGITDEAIVAVQQLNGDLTALHRNNISLLRSVEGSDNRAALLDERDRLLDRISSALPVQADYGEQGQVTLRAASAGGPVLVYGSGAASIALAQTPDGRLSFSVGATPQTPSTGSLAGYVVASNHVANQRADLDTFAQQIAIDLNAAHASGTDALGNPGAPMFTYSAAGFVANALSPSNVAAADASGPSGNLIALSSLRGPGGIEDAWAQQLSAQSLLVNQQRGEDAAAGARRDAAYIARSEGSAVNLDREAADLLHFQQAYQAAARVIQVARENMQSILSAI